MARAAAQQTHTLVCPYPSPVEYSSPRFRQVSTVLNGRPISGATCCGRSIRWTWLFGLVAQLQVSVTACPRCAGPGGRGVVGGEWNTLR